MSYSRAPWLHHMEDAARLGTLADWLEHVVLEDAEDQEEIARCTHALARVAFASGVLMRQLGELSADRCDFADHLLADERYAVTEAHRMALVDRLGALVDAAQASPGEGGPVVAVADLLPLLGRRA